MLSKELSGGSFCRTAAFSAAATFSCFDGRPPFSGLLRWSTARFACFVSAAFLDSGRRKLSELCCQHFVATCGESCLICGVVAHLVAEAGLLHCNARTLSGVSRRSSAGIRGRTDRWLTFDKAV